MRWLNNSLCNEFVKRVQRVESSHSLLILVSVIVVWLTLPEWLLCLRYICNWLFPPQAIRGFLHLGYSLALFCPCASWEQFSEDGGPFLTFDLACQIGYILCHEYFLKTITEGGGKRNSASRRPRKHTFQIMMDLQCNAYVELTRLIIGRVRWKP